MPFEVFKDSQKKWRFRFRAENGEIVAQSEAYESKARARGGIDSIIYNVMSPFGAEIREIAPAPDAAKDAPGEQAEKL